MRELGQIIAKFFSIQEDAAISQISKESVQLDEIDQVKVTSQNVDIVTQFLNIVDEIAQEKGYHQALDFIIYSIRTSEIEMKQMVMTASNSSDKTTSSEENLDLAKGDLLVPSLILIKGDS